MSVPPSSRAAGLMQGSCLTAIPEVGQGPMPGGKANSILRSPNKGSAAWCQEGAVESQGREGPPGCTLRKPGLLHRPEDRSKPERAK